MTGCQFHELILPYLGVNHFKNTRTNNCAIEPEIIISLYFSQPTTYFVFSTSFKIVYLLNEDSK